MKTDEGRRNAAVVLSLVFILFQFTVHNSKTVTLEDDGLFIMASLDGGVAHPPAIRSSLF